MTPLPLPSSAACVRLACLALALWSSPMTASAMTPQEAKSALGSALRGGTTCGKRIGTELVVSEVTASKEGFKVAGSYRTTDMAGQEKAPRQEAPWNGNFNPVTGFLQLRSTMPPPKDPKACPKGMETIFGRKMECSFTFPGSAMLAERQAKKDAELALASQFTAVLGPSPTGDGWRGTIVNSAYTCPEVLLQSDGGSGPRAFPPPSGQTALDQSAFVASQGRIGSDADPAPARIYWLSLAADRGSREANFRLADAYQTGDGVAQDYARAARHYRVASDAGDARAQTALAGLLAKGMGVPPDVAESERLLKLANNTRVQASRVCVSEPAIAEFDRLMIESLSDPSAMLLGAIVGAFTGTDIDPGSIRIINVAAKAVSSIDQPFVCEVTARRIGMTLRNIKPEWEIYGETTDGYVVARDQRFESRMNAMLADGVTGLMANVPWVQGFVVASQGGTLYRATMSQQLAALSRSYEAMIDIGSTRPMQQPPVGSATGRDAARQAAAPGPELPRVGQVLNDRLTAMSRSWRFDRYVADSIRMGKTQCDATRCAVEGTFDFTRGFAQVTAPFSSSMLRRGGEFEVVKLCYVDPINNSESCR